jgi:hypothetical protein
MAVNDVLYSDSGLTTLFNGNSQWYKIIWKGAVGTDDVYAVQISSTGVVLAWQYCPSTTTTTSTSTSTTTAAAPTTATIIINNSNSLDIPITDVTVNGVSITFVQGTNFTISAGNNGTFTTDQLGTQNVVIYYGGHIPGQNISFQDSNNNIDCQDLNGPAGSFTIASATITAGTEIYITGADGSCV